MSASHHSSFLLPFFFVHYCWWVGWVAGALRPRCTHPSLSFSCVFPMVVVVVVVRMMMMISLPLFLLVHNQQVTIRDLPAPQQATSFNILLVRVALPGQRKSAAGGRGGKGRR